MYKRQIYLRHYPNRGSGFSFIILPKREVLQPAVSRDVYKRQIPYREDESAKTFEKRSVIQGIMNYIRKNKSRVNKLLFLQWDRY